MRNAYKHYLIITFATILVSGCSSKQTFSTAAPPGGTVTLPIGAYYELNRADLSATIQPCVGIWPTGIDQTTARTSRPSTEHGIGTTGCRGIAGTCFAETPQPLPCLAGKTVTRRQPRAV